jgi:general secretion pathway protein G
MMNRLRRRYNLGFTFVEVMVTLAIMAVLAMVTVPMAQLTAQRQKERDLRRALIQIREALDAYKRASEQGRIPVALSESGYPKRLDDLWIGVVDARSPERRKLYFLRRLPTDPMRPDDALAPAANWGLRSYESPPDQPKAGTDVFDVYSTSEKTGLNGVPYRQW